MPDIEARIKQWNKSNNPSLSQSYIIGQLNWHRRQKDKVLPPNCANEGYYKDLGIKCPDKPWGGCKNPVYSARSNYKWNKKQQDKEIKKAAKKAAKKKKRVKKKENVSDSK